MKCTYCGTPLVGVMNQPAHLAPGAETYEQKRVRLRVPSGTIPGPRGSYASFTAGNGVSVKIWVTWFIGSGWYFTTEVWDLKVYWTSTVSDDSKGIYTCGDAPIEGQHTGFKGSEFWECVAAGEKHARKLMALFDGQFPAPLTPYSRVDGPYGDNAK